MKNELRVYYGTMNGLLSAQRLMEIVRSFWPNCTLSDESGKESALFLKDAEHAKGMERHLSSCCECLLIEWNNDSSVEEELTADVEIFASSDGGQDELALLIFQKLGVARKDRPEYVKCVAQNPSPTEQVMSYCGREIGMKVGGSREILHEWAFVDAQHAMAEALHEGRLLICCECTKKMRDLLDQQSAPMYIVLGRQ